MQKSMSLPLAFFTNLIGINLAVLILREECWRAQKLYSCAMSKYKYKGREHNSLVDQLSGTGEHLNSSLSSVKTIDVQVLSSDFSLICII